MKTLMRIAISYLCFIYFAFPSYSYADEHNNSSNRSRIELVKSHEYSPTDITVMDAEKAIIVTGKVIRRHHSQLHIRSKVSVEILDKHHEMLAKKTILVHREADKASNQRYLPFTVRLPANGAKNYLVRVTTM